MSSRQPKKQLSNEQRYNLINLVFNYGESVVVAASKLMIKYKTAARICLQFEKTGSVERKKPSGRKREFGTPVKLRLAQFIDSNADATLDDCRQHLIATRATDDEPIPSRSTIDRILATEKFTSKALSVIPPQRNSPETISLRKQYVEKYLRLKSDWNFISTDEFGCNKGLRRGRGRSKRGQPAFVIGPLNRGRNLSVVTAIDKTGVLHHHRKLGSIDKFEFVAFLDGLSAKLDTNKKNILLMDNLRAHHTEEVKRKLRELNVRAVFLPPYSPFLQPIELCFSKVKDPIKKKLSAGLSLFESIDYAFSQVTASDCTSWFAHTERYIPKCLNEEPIYKSWRSRRKKSQTFRVMTSWFSFSLILNKICRIPFEMHLASNGTVLIHFGCNSQFLWLRSHLLWETL